MINILRRQSLRSASSASRVNVALFNALNVRRGASSYIDIDDDLHKWPKSKYNSVINVCPEGTQMVIERLGQIYDVQKGGLFFAIPILDRISYVIDMREKALSISPQSCITKDNVHVQVSGTLYCQYVDAAKAAYGSKNPVYAVKQHAQSSMRAAIGELELDQVLHARGKVNAIIRESLQAAGTTWGLEIKRYEITEVTPDILMTEAMNKQAAAERERRAKVLEAEGDKTSAELESQGTKIRMKNESEGMLIKISNEAEARKIQLILEAEGNARCVELHAKAQAEAITVIARALQAPLGAEAAKLHLAKEYITMYSDIGQKSNTMIFNDRPGDVNALIAQASAVLSAHSGSNFTAKTGHAENVAAVDTSHLVHAQTGNSQTAKKIISHDKIEVKEEIVTV